MKANRKKVEGNHTAKKNDQRERPVTREEMEEATAKGPGRYKGSIKPTSKTVENKRKKDIKR